MKRTGTIKRSALALGAVAALLLSACGSDESADDATGASSDSASQTTAAQGEDSPDPPTERFGWGYGTGASSLDPHAVTSSYEMTFLNPIYDTLIRRTATGDLEPLIAESWELTDDGLQFTLQIAEGRTFHDGNPIDADAVVANLERARSDESVVAGGLDGVDTIEATGDLEVVLTLSEPGGALAGVLADQAGMMISPADFEDGDMPDLPHGSGPFTAAQWSDAEVNYDRWPDYFDAENIRLAGIDMYVQRDDTARLSSVISGETDATYIRTTQLAEADAAGLDTEQKQRTQFYGVHVVTDRPEFQDPAVRQAMMHGLNRASIDENVYEGMCLPSVQYFPPTFSAHDSSIDFDEYGAFDPDQARQLLADAGVTGELSAELTAPNITTYTRLAQVLQEQLNEVGFAIDINVVESTELSKTRREGTSDLVLAPIDAGRPDPTEFFSSNFAPGGANNAAGFEIPGLPEMLTEANSTVDESARNEILHEISGAILDYGTPLVPVCLPATITAARENVEGFEIPVFGNWDFREVKLG